MNNINIISESEATAWRMLVEQANQQTHDLLQDVGETLKQVKDDADSTIVDEIYKYGCQVTESANKILEGMNELTKMVKGLLDAVSNVLDEGKNVVKSIINGIGKIF